MPFASLLSLSFLPYHDEPIAGAIRSANHKPRPCLPTQALSWACSSGRALVVLAAMTERPVTNYFSRCSLARRLVDF